MKRIIMLVVVALVMAATLAAGSGAALAVTKQGGPGNDLILGTEGPDDLGGGFGSDSVIGLGANDVLGGGLLGDNDPAEKSPHRADRMIGGPGNDFMYGDLGADLILGGAGDDFLLDGEFRGGASDLMFGGPGNDVLYPRNDPAGSDLIMCGAGTDVAHVDRADVVVGCERVLYRFITSAEFAQYLAERGLQGRV
jgi:Ca2+-binding RTX toxin-like protein